MSHVPAGNGKNQSTTGPEQASPETTPPPSEKTPNTPRAMKVWTALDAFVGSALWAFSLLALFEMWPKEFGRLGVMFAALLFLVFTLRGANHLHGQYKNILMRQGFYINHLESQVGLSGMLIVFLKGQLGAMAEKAFVGRIKEFLEHTPVDDVTLVFEPPDKVIIRLSGGNTTVDIDYNELAKDFQGTVNDAKEEFLDKYHAED